MGERRGVLRVLLALSLATFCADIAGAQRPADTERLAALRFVIANGFRLPAGVTVATETVSDSTRPRPKPTRVAQRNADATALAAEIGSSARTGSAIALVQCHRRVCVAAGVQSVVVISDPEFTPQDRTVVGVELYSKDNTGANLLTGASVVVARRDGGWIGTAFSIEPFTVRPRVPPR